MRAVHLIVGPLILLGLLVAAGAHPAVCIIVFALLYSIWRTS